MRHDELSRALDALFAARAERPGAPATLDALRRGLALVPDVTRLLDAIMADPALCQALSAASYAHPNAFDKLVLVDGGARYKLRLHAWPAGERCASDVHDHRWDFGSRILRGGYSFQEHERRPHGPLYARRYFSPGAADSFAVDRFERAGTACVRRGRVRAGDEYVLAADVLHRVIPDGRGPTLTLFLQGPVVRPWTTVLSRRPPPVEGPSARVPLRRLTAAEYGERLARLRALLAAGRAPATFAA